MGCQAADAVINQFFLGTGSDRDDPGLQKGRPTFVGVDADLGFFDLGGGFQASGDFPQGDPFAVDQIDERFDYREERRIVVAQSVSSLLHVVYTERGDVTRIISAREATRNEQDNYYRQNAP